MSKHPDTWGQQIAHSKTFMLIFQKYKEKAKNKKKYKLFLGLQWAKKRQNNLPPLNSLASYLLNKKDSHKVMFQNLWKVWTDNPLPQTT